MLPETIGFVLIDDFALMSAAAAIEPLRAANLLSATTCYTIRFLSEHGGPARASCGASFATEPFARAAGPFDRLFVVAGANPFAVNARPHVAFLRREAATGTALGGISGGAVPLARAGLMQGRRFTVHWEHIAALREEDPEHLIERRLFVLDRDRATCAGGIAPMDMMHALIRATHGQSLADAVSDWFIHTRQRPAEAPQRASESAAGPLHPAVATAIRLMEDHIAEPLDLPRLARLAGLSPRQLQRHFLDDFGQTVMARYTRIRLAKADELIRQTRLPIGQIALVCGFANQSNFSRAFARAYGMAPGLRRSV